MKISLVAYTVRVKKKGVKDQNTYYYHNCPLHNFDNINDLFDVCIEFLNQLSDSKVDKKYSRYITTNKIFPDVKNRSVYGLLDCGLFGDPAHLINIETSKIKHTRKTDEAETRPFYFRFYFLRNSDLGVLLLQKNGVHGIKDFFSYSFKNFFNIKFIGYNLEIFPLTSNEVLQRVFNQSTVKKLRLVKRNVPIDVADEVREGKNGITEETYNLELSLSNNGFFGFKKKLSHFLETNRNQSLKKLIEVPGFENFDYDTIKMEVDVDGSKQIFDLSMLESVHEHYNITELIKFNRNGFPDFESTNQVAKKYLSSIIDKL